MNKFVLSSILAFLEFFFIQIFSIPWSLFDFLLALVVIFTFYHSLDVRDFVFYALFCGLLRDLFSLDIFGIHMFSYLTCALCVRGISIVLNRHNWFFVLPLVFLATLLNDLLILIVKLLFFNFSYQIGWGWFFIRNFFKACGTTLIAFCLYIFLKKRCALGFTDS